MIIIKIKIKGNKKYTDRTYNRSQVLFLSKNYKPVKEVKTNFNGYGYKDTKRYYELTRLEFNKLLKKRNKKNPKNRGTKKTNMDK